MTHTPTLPTNDRTMWRKAKAKVHPDAGGDHELFIWLGNIEELVCSGGERSRSEPSPYYHASREEPARVPYAPDTDFQECTRTALKIAAYSMPYGRILSLLSDCHPLDHLACEQERGASYKRLAAIGHAWSLTKAERTGWYRVAEDISLSDRHAGHILSRLKERTA